MRALFVIVALLFLGASVAHWIRTREERVARPALAANVVLISFCTMRADRVLSGALVPNISAVAADAAVFTSHYTQASYSGGSFASIVTGLYPFRHGIYDHPMKLEEQHRTLAEILREVGLRTAGFVSHGYLSKRYGFDQGFEHFADRGRRRSRLKPAEERVRDAVRWIRAHARERFFVWVQIGNTHYPYEELPPDFAPSDAAEAYARFRQRVKGLPHGRIQFDFPFVGFTADELSAAIRHYDAEVRYADHLAGKVLGTLDRLGLRDSTLVVVTADHGEALGEHSLFVNHDSNLYEHTVRVPLVVRGPGISPRKVSAASRNIDLVPTIAGLVGGAVEDVDGTSLAAHLEGSGAELTVFAETRPWVKERAVYRGYRLSVPGVAGKMRMIRQGRYKLIELPGAAGITRELYDLAADPGEERNLADRESERVARLAAELGRWFSGYEGRTAEPPRLEPDEVESLRSLGYLQ